MRRGLQCKMWSQLCSNHLGPKLGDGVAKKDPSCCVWCQWSFKFLRDRNVVAPPPRERCPAMTNLGKKPGRKLTKRAVACLEKRHRNEVGTCGFSCNSFRNGIRSQRRDVEQTSGISDRRRSGDGKHLGGKGNIGMLWNNLAPPIDLTEESVLPNPGQILRCVCSVTLWVSEYNSWFWTPSRLVLGEISDKRPKGSGRTVVQVRLNADGLAQPRTAVCLSRLCCLLCNKRQKTCLQCRLQTITTEVCLCFPGLDKGGRAPSPEGKLQEKGLALPDPPKEMMPTFSVDLNGCPSCRRDPICFWAPLCRWGPPLQR